MAESVKLLLVKWG